MTGWARVPVRYVAHRSPPGSGARLLPLKWLEYPFARPHQGPEVADHAPYHFRVADDDTQLQI